MRAMHVAFLCTGLPLSPLWVRDPSPTCITIGQTTGSTCYPLVMSCRGRQFDAAKRTTTVDTIWNPKLQRHFLSPPFPKQRTARAVRLHRSRNYSAASPPEMEDCGPSLPSDAQETSSEVRSLEVPIVGGTRA
ncbi:hypothetical protein BHE74_00025963 [Ensete ventricosum]|nr:hypothetical protein GW17_00015637 [Ensete ventricosum]RWW66659.1 hypothetical protein BHE74_00025963 [Ensete ventricosum]RZR81434.1 hypothetical protein BHM03_00007653 [Ensete ventricosum]